MATSQITAGAMSMGPVVVEGGDGGSAGVPPSPLQNRAKESKSPFIASAADSPVAWQILDDATVERARRENKLLFLHIGYQACHRRCPECHVRSAADVLTRARLLSDGK